MEKDRFDRSLKEALTRMQPTPPTDMTERFMARVQKEGASVKPRRRYFLLWRTSPVVAVAAAVLLLVFLPLKRKDNMPVIVSSSTQEEKLTSVEEMASMVVEKEVVEENLPTTPAIGKRSGKSKRKAVKMLAQAALVSETVEDASLSVPADTSGLPASVSETSDIAQEPAASVYTEHEKELMALAEEKRQHAEMYIAELLQSVLVEEQEREYEHQVKVAEKIVVENV